MIQHFTNPPYTVRQLDQNHAVMGGEIQLFKRPNSKFWYGQATMGGRQLHRFLNSSVK